MLACCLLCVPALHTATAATAAWDVSISSQQLLIMVLVILQPACSPSAARLHPYSCHCLQILLVHLGCGAHVMMICTAHGGAAGTPHAAPTPLLLLYILQGSIGVWGE
jgi:hypothetical protein